MKPEARNLKEKLNLSFISANKHSFLSKREVKMAVYSPRKYFFRVTMDRDKVEVHKKTSIRLLFSLLDQTCLVNKVFTV